MIIKQLPWKQNNISSLMKTVDGLTLSLVYLQYQGRFVAEEHIKCTVINCERNRKRGRRRNSGYKLNILRNVSIIMKWTPKYTESTGKHDSDLGASVLKDFWTIEAKRNTLILRVFQYKGLYQNSLQTSHRIQQTIGTCFHTFNVQLCHTTVAYIKLTERL